MKRDDSLFIIRYLDEIRSVIAADQPKRIAWHERGEARSIQLQNPKYGTELSRVIGDKSDFDSLDDESYSVPVSFEFDLREVDLVTQFGILKIDNFVSRESLFHFPGHKFSSFKRETQEDGTELLAVDIKDPALRISLGYCVQNGIQENYYHWLVLILPKVNRRFLRDNTLPKPILIFSPFENEIQSESAQIIAAHYGLSFMNACQDITIRVDQLIYPTINRMGGHKPEPLVKDTFAILKASLYEPSHSGYDKIYISRRDSKNRILINEEDLENLLTKNLGYHVVRLSDKTLKYQVNLFARAKFIISPHGAGLTNIGFCETGASVLEIHMPGYLAWSFRRLAALNNLSYGFILGSLISSPDTPLMQRTYRVSLEDVLGAALGMEKLAMETIK